MPPEGKRLREEPHPNERPEALHPHDDNMDDGEFICDECKAVDWSSLPGLAANGSLKHHLNSSEPLRTINATSDQLKSSPCRVCRILSLIAPGSLDPPDFKDDKPHHFLQAMPIPMVVEGDHIYERYDPEATVLSVSCDKFRGSHLKCGFNRRRSLAVMKTRGERYPVTIRKITPSSINFDEIHALIDRCKIEHEVCYKGRSFDNLPGFRVIDITTRTVIRAPYRCIYLALSYVWGESEDDNYANNLMAPPPVIEDAIQFAISMRYKYLWVDRHVSSCGWISSLIP